MKRIFSLFIMCVLFLGICLSVFSCGSGLSLGMNFYGNYADAAKYSVGNFTYTPDGIETVEINWVGGEIELVQSEGEELSVSENGKTLDSEEQLHYYINNGKLIIHYCESGYKKEIKSGFKKLRVEIPAGVNVDIDNVSADISVGNMSVANFKLTNVSGDVVFEDIIAKNVEIEIVSGKISADYVAVQSFEVKGVSGNINVGRISADDIDIEIVSGKTEFALLKASGVDISGVSGSVKIALPEDIGASVEFSSVSGDIHSEREHKKNGDRYTFGNAESNIDVETVSGDLYIE